MSPPGHGSARLPRTPPPSLPEMPPPSTRGFVFPPYRRRVNNHDAWRVVPASEEFASAGLGSPHAARAQVPFLDALSVTAGNSWRDNSQGWATTGNIASKYVMGQLLCQVLGGQDIFAAGVRFSSSKLQGNANAPCATPSLLG